MLHVVKKQDAGKQCLLSIPKELAKAVVHVDFFKVDFDNGRLIFSPIED